jgi:hypothetical protein
MRGRVRRSVDSYNPGLQTGIEHLLLLGVVSNGEIVAEGCNFMNFYMQKIYSERLE